MKKTILRSLFLSLLLLIATADLSRAQGSVPDKDDWVEVSVEPRPLIDIQRLVVYPVEAQRQNIEGKVTVSALIHEDGHVMKVELEQSENEMLNEAAITAMQKAKFSPAMQGTKPVKVWYTQTILFRLNPPLPKASSSSSSSSRSSSTISSSIIPATLIGKQPVLPYTEELKDHSEIIVSLEIGKSGVVLDVRALDPDDQSMLTEPVLKVLRDLKFTPAEYDGEKILNAQAMRFSVKSPSVKDPKGRKR